MPDRPNHVAALSKTVAALPGLHMSVCFCLEQHRLNVGSEVSDRPGTFSP